MKHNLITISCPLCKSNNFQDFYNYGAPGKIQLDNIICKNCGLVYQKKPDSFDNIRDYYQDYMNITQSSIASIPRSFEEHILSIARYRFDYIKQFVRMNDRVLDIGCSFGGMLKILKDNKEYNFSLTGINPEATMANFGKTNYGLDIIAGMVEEIDIKPSSYDFIILDNVIEHLQAPSSIINKIHSLLDDKGRLFIVTNNLDEPHGFLWQNFFPDHTVTFSPKTIRCLLESEGFDVLDINTMGHITYEGYHYPYMYIVAIKGTRPEKYDFHLNGDRYEEKIIQIDKYESDYKKLNKWGKKMFLLSSRQKMDAIEKTILGVFKYLNQLRKKIGLHSCEHIIMNHTLPPEEYFIRHIAVAICGTKNDENLFNTIVKNSELEPCCIIYRKYLGQKYKLISYDKTVISSKLPDAVESKTQLLDGLAKSLKRFDDIILVSMNDADLPRDVLRKTYDIYRKNGGNAVTANYTQFTDALLYIFGTDALREIIHNSNNESLGLRNHTYVWPDKQDYEYYYKEKFNKYYKYPKAVSLDLSPACNKQCDKCQFHSQRSPYAEIIKRCDYMPLDMAKGLLDQIAGWEKKPAISPTYSGEPLLYPYIKEVIKYCRDIGLKLSITTNALILNEDISRNIVDYEVESVLVSIDAYRDETYRILQPPGELKKVVANVDKLIEIRGKNKKPSIGVHFVMEQRNENEHEEYLKYWIGKVDFVSRAIIQDQFDQCQLKMPPFFSLGKRQACWGPWTTIYIRADGRISYCGFDIDGKTSGLNAKGRDLLEIWNSDEYWNWRNAQLENDRSVLYCKACPDWAALKIKRDGDVEQSPFTEVYRKK